MSVPSAPRKNETWPEVWPGVWTATQSGATGTRPSGGSASRLAPKS